MTAILRVAIATQYGLQNAEHIATAATETGVPMRWAFALIEQESGGANVVGRYDDSPFAGYPGPVTKGWFKLFYWLVTERGWTPTGINAGQITYAGALKGGKRDGGYFREMEAEGLKPWVPLDSIRKALRIFRDHYDRVGDWETAAGHFNGGTTPNRTYGGEVRDKARAWRQRWREAGA